MTIKKAKINNVWMVSGFKDKSQDKDLIKTGFDNRILKVFDTEDEADTYIKDLNN